MLAPVRCLLLTLAYVACTADRKDPDHKPRPGVVLLYSKAVARFDTSDSLDERIVKEAETTRAGRKQNGQRAGRKPKCAKDAHYCLYDEDYPMDKVSDMINKYHEEIHRMYHDTNPTALRDILHYDNRTHAYRHKGSFVCESEVAYVRPGWARNWRGEWVVVVNTDKYPQSVRVETCKYEGMKCEYLPPCYKSFCVQRSNLVKLICVDPFNMHRHPVVDTFEIPSACACFVENFVYY